MMQTDPKMLQAVRAKAVTIRAPKGKELFCLQPLYMRRFVCDGSRCSSLCCCAKWGVVLDKATLARYEKYPKLLRELKKGLKRSEVTGDFVMRHENERCVFLCEDGLCFLHRHFGIGAISDVCAEYPRKMHQIGRTLDRALCLSCPVAAKEVLFTKEPLTFEWLKIAAPRPDYVDRVPLALEIDDKAFRTLQLSCIALLGDRRLSIDTRLAALGLMLSRAEEYVREEKAPALTKDAPAIANAATKAAPTFLAANPFAAAKYLAFFLRLFPALKKATKDDLPETALYQKAIEKTFGKATGELKTTILSLAAHRQFYKERVLPIYENALENWLINEFLLGRYPLLGGASFLANYEVFVVLYKMLEFLLILDATPDAACKDQAARWHQKILAAVEWLAVRTNHFVGYIDVLAEEISRLLPGDTLFCLFDATLREKI